MGVVTRQLERLWRELSGTTEIDVVVIAAAAALLASIGAHVAVSWSRGSRVALAVTLGPAIVLGASAMAAAGRLAQQAREDALEHATTGIGWSWDQLTAELGWLLLTITLALVLIPTIGAAITRAASQPSARWLSAGATVLATTSALTASGYLFGFLGVLNQCAFASSAQHAALLDGLSELDRGLATGTWILIVIAVGTTVAFGYRRAREGGPRFTTGAHVLCLLVFVSGVAAFVATRGHAWDRQHPQRLSDRQWYADALDPIAGLRASCSDPELGPVVRVDDDGRVSIDRRRMSSPPDLAADLATLRRNWAILHPRERFSGVLLLHAPPDTRLAPIAPYLVAARDVGYVHLLVAAYRAAPVSTRSLGVVQAIRECFARVEMTSGAAPLPATVADLVHEIQAGRETLAL